MKIFILLILVIGLLVGCSGEKPFTKLGDTLRYRNGDTYTIIGEGKTFYEIVLGSEYFYRIRVDKIDVEIVERER